MAVFGDWDYVYRVIDFSCHLLTVFLRSLPKMKPLLFTLSIAHFLIVISSGQDKTVSYVNSYKHHKGKPQSYYIVEKEVTIYVESNGRTVSAIQKTGEILWTVDPFVDAKLEFYRTKNPKIIYVGKASESRIESLNEEVGKGTWVGLTYSSTQFGCLRIEDGKFIFSGQD